MQMTLTLLALTSTQQSMAGNCTSTLEMEAEKMRLNYNVTIDNIKLQEAVTSSSQFTNASDEVFFVLYERPNAQVNTRIRGYSHNFMNSAQIQLGIAKNVISNCKSVYRVRYGLNFTDAIREYVIDRNGEVREVIAPYGEL